MVLRPRATKAISGRFSFSEQKHSHKKSVFFFSPSASRVGITTGVVVAVVVIFAIILIAIFFLKRKNRRVVTNHNVFMAGTATTAVTITQPLPAGYVQPIPQQYPSPVTQTGPPPGVHYPRQQPGNCVPNAGPGMPINAANGTYPPPLGAMPTAQVPPPYYQSEEVKPIPTTVST